MARRKPGEPVGADEAAQRRAFRRVGSMLMATDPAHAFSGRLCAERYRIDRLGLSAGEALDALLAFADEHGHGDQARRVAARELVASPRGRA